MLFQLWKSHGGRAFSHGQRAARVLCEVYARLLGLLVQHWMLMMNAKRLLGWSWTKSARRVRRQAVALGQALASLVQVVVVLERLGRRIRRRCREATRQQRPTAYQLVRNPELTEYLDYSASLEEQAV